MTKKIITLADAPTLRDLLYLLNADLLPDGITGEAPAYKQEERIDVTSLPLYGGTEPHALDGVYSYDAEYLLRCDNDEWEIVPRDACS